ncbi:hypothetical protein HPP92_018038 [Vanilla planifolia]|uniref:Enoyl-[acyl-carrier-protein] reductase, mitochondrial n=1 Tax=Vanilla planifolia TaxID=51239 RepID=A0A835Q923_VANPL|nr:hypothetical protein HPP92_018038 [Vanilla planifolia]
MGASRVAVRSYGTLRRCVSPRALPLQFTRNIRAFAAAAVSPPSKAVVYEQHGSPDQIVRIVDLPPEEIKVNDVCVRMLASPINPSDINRMEGVYPVRPQVPAVAGYEGVGEVHSLGSGVCNLAVGDWVIPSPPSFGTWQTYIVKEETSWHKIRKDIPMEYAATVTVNPLTALRMLEDFVELTSGDSIVQNGATSIVGQCIIQLARIKGISNINVIRDRPGSEEVKEKLKKLGADASEIPEPLLGFNCIGGDSASLVLRLLRQGGTMLTYGGMAKKPVIVSTSSFIFKDLTLRGFWLQKWMTTDKAKDCRTMIDYLLSLVQCGKLKYEMEIVPFTDFNLALDKALGKLGSKPKQIIKF